MQEQQSMDVAGLEIVAETRKEWCSPRLRVASVDHETQATFTGMAEGGVGPLVS